MAVQQTVPQEEVLSFPESPLPTEAPAPEQQSAPSPKSPETEPPPSRAPEHPPKTSSQSPRPQGKRGPKGKKRRRRTSPVPVSMWLLPPFRLPFSNPREFLLWFLAGVNLWAIGAVLFCALGGYFLLGWLGQPRMTGVEQALAGGEGTRGLSYRVEQVGDGEAAVTGIWDPEKEESPPGPELAAALCAALSPDPIYGHSQHLYRSIANRFFEGKDFTLTILLQEAAKEKEEPLEPLFSVTRGPGDQEWPQPQCDAAFLREWKEAYGRYWSFGQGRKEEMGPPQSDPILEEGDLPPEESGGQEEEEAPPLPDLEGTESNEGSSPEEGEESSLPEETPPPEPEPPASSRPPAEPPDGFFGWILEKAAQYRAEQASRS